MTNVYYSCSFVPPELIMACGCKPGRLTPALQNAHSSLSEGICPFTRAFLNELTSISQKQVDCIAIFSTSCDQMRRAYDAFRSISKKPSFLLNIPSTTTENSLNYYKQELIRLKDFLCTITDKTFDENKLYYSKNETNPNESNRHTKIALIGGPIPNSILKNIKTLLKPYDADITLQATEDMLKPSKCKSTQYPSIRKLSECYFQRPAIWKRPNDALYTWFAQQLQHKHIDGVLLLRYVFCDLWHSSTHEFKKGLSIPLLDIDLDGSAELTVSAISRIQAFMETMSR